jgi:lipopolysaccharide biosynthesis glycosyltransferase
MDGDTIVRKDLSGLYSTDISDYTLAAAIEPTVPAYRKEELGLAKDANYYNAGILLINLKKWREKNTSDRILKYFEDHGGKLFANDQDAINGCLADEILPVSISYNFCNTYDFYPYRAIRKWIGPENNLSKQEYKSICADPAIIHFLGEERPWRYGSRHRFGKDFFKYYKKTPIGWDMKTRYNIIEHGWERYFFCFYLFNMMMKPFPGIRLKIINSLIPVFMKIRSRKLKKK